MGRARAAALDPAGMDLPGVQTQEVLTAKSFDHLRGLTGLSDAQVTEHLDLYAGHVKQVNSLVQELSEMRTERGETGKDFSLAEGTRRLAYEYDGMVLPVDQPPSRRDPGALEADLGDGRVGARVHA